MQRGDGDPHHGDPQHDDPVDGTPDDEIPDDEIRDRGVPDSLAEAQSAALPPTLSTVVSPPRWYGTDTSRTLSTPGTDNTATHTPEEIPVPNTVTWDGAGSHGTVSDSAGQAIGMPEDTGGPARQSVDQHGDAHPHDRPADRRVHHVAGQLVDRYHSHPADHPAEHSVDGSVGGAGPAATASRTDHHHEEDRLADDAVGPDASFSDIARAARSAFVGKDLLQSGPALWPFGRRARQRRARNRQVAEEARRRRAQFLDAFNGGFDRGFDGGFDEATTRASSTPTPPPRATQEAPVGARSARSSGRRSVDRRTNTVVIACLTGVVLAAVLAVVWRGEPEPPADSRPPPAEPASSSTPYSSTRPATTSTAGPAAIPPQPPIPTGGVNPIPPRPGAPIVDPRSVRLVEPPPGDPTPAELSSPDGAMRAWLSRVCPFDFTDAFGTAERRAKPAMTDAGWATLNPDNDTPRAERSRASWDTTVAARESGRCAEPAATISPEAPRSDASAIVIGAITRVITTHTGSEQAPYVEQLSEVRIVRRGTDGLWRVDLAAEGG